MSVFGRTARLAGFTLIEMLVTVAIVGVLSTIAFPLVQLANQRVREAELRDALRQIRTAIDAYKQAVDDGRIQQDIKSSGFPPNLEVLVEGVADTKNAQGGSKIYFLRRLPMDPMFPAAEQTQKVAWGLRSYASSATDPQAGPDVFDVYSQSDGTGLNGVKYRDW